MLDINGTHVPLAHTVHLKCQKKKKKKKKRPVKNKESAGHYTYVFVS